MKIHINTFKGNDLLGLNNPQCFGKNGSVLLWNAVR